MFTVTEQLHQVHPLPQRNERAPFVTRAHPRDQMHHMRALSILLIAAAASSQGCVRLPPLAGRISSTALDETTATRLGQAAVPLVRSHPGLSGVVTIPNGPDAFAARVLLADAAERTLDAQYYVWHDDLTGTLLFDALRRAADRGVRVRLLLDDNNTKGLDALLASLDAHPNIQVRLFNPVVHRGRQRILDFALDFQRLNRRMHNKSFTVDNQVTVVGGRNVADEYFGAGDDPIFADLDVLAIGPVVADVSRSFDRYWASESTYPADRILAAPGSDAVNLLSNAVARVRQDSGSLTYTRALAQSPFVRELLAGRLALEWAPTTLLSDDPAKGLGRVPDDSLMWPRLRVLLGRPTRELAIISPYFVPGGTGAEYFRTLARSGVAIEVLTNSLEATDVAAVHAGYSKRRSSLLKGGVSLFELKRHSPVVSRGSFRLGGRSASSLHAKTISVDGSRVFIGSFNFDPRSARLNTEMGFVIESPVMAQAITGAFKVSVPERAYQVRIGSEGLLRWMELQSGRTRVFDQEPGTSVWRRLSVMLMSLLPIDRLL
jgi:putative cardiolipin synthase